MAFRLVGRQMAAGAGRALLGAPTTQIRKQLAAGRVLLGAPRTQMRGYCQQFSSGQGGHFHPEGHIGKCGKSISQVTRFILRGLWRLKRS
ncbi:uncharacterized protein [Nicotiana tomentosiformis]|uniref:uncharacterized protein isoform X4 n=1 Tax=Nicotiana tomentosiformis TaxID=4098 RepID=UPI00388C9793